MPGDLLNPRAGMDWMFVVRRLAVVALLGAALAVVIAQLPAQPSLASAPGAQGAPIRPWDSLLSVTSPASGKWFVVGKNGVLLTSTDGGRTWSRRELAQRGDLSWFDLYSVRFAAGGQSGWISGENGIVLHSADGGATWTAQKSGVTSPIFRIVPIDSRRAVGAGADGTLMWTDNGGENWHPQSFKGAIAFFDLAFGDENNGWAVGEFATVVHTADGGRTWSLQHGGNRTDFRAPAFMSATFLDSKQGWVAGQGGTVMYTPDGGNTWQPVTSPIDAPIYGAHFVPAPGGGGSLWFVGAEGNLFSLSVAPSPGPATRLRPSFTSLVEVAIAGADGVAVGVDGTILRTQDRGKNWGQVQTK